MVNLTYYRYTTKLLYSHNISVISERCEVGLLFNVCVASILLQVEILTQKIKKNNDDQLPYIAPRPVMLFTRLAEYIVYYDTTAGVAGHKCGVLSSVEPQYKVTGQRTTTACEQKITSDRRKHGTYT